MSENSVLYMMCPHCKTGWFGKVKYRGNNCVIVEGLEDTDVTKELTCLACGHRYTPINDSLMMWDFVAKAVMSVKGN